MEFFGYGIVDRDGHPWWDEGCVCRDKQPLEDVVENLNDPYTKDDAQPYRVVRLYYYRPTRPTKRRTHSPSSPPSRPPRR